MGTPRSVTDCDSEDIVVAQTYEVFIPITNLAVVAGPYESNTEMTVAVLVLRCQDKILRSTSITRDKQQIARTALQ